MSSCFNGKEAYKRLQRSTGTTHPVFVAGTPYEACLHEGTKVTTKDKEKVKLEGCVVPAIVPITGGDCADCADINLNAQYENVGGYEWEVTFDDNYNDGERITHPLGNIADPTPSGLIPVCYRCNPTKDRKSKDDYYAKAMKKQEKNRARPPSTGAAGHICGMMLESGLPCTKSVRADGLMCLVSLSLFHVHISYTYIYTHVITLSHTIHLPLILCLDMHESISEVSSCLLKEEFMHLL